MVWESKQQAALSAVERIFMKTLNFASRFEYGPVQRTIIERKMKLAITVVALAASASAFAPQATFSRPSTVVFSDGPKVGAGGMADTRDPEAQDNEDPRKSISAAPSFEEYMKQKQAEGN